MTPQSNGDKRFDELAETLEISFVQDFEGNVIEPKRFLKDIWAESYYKLQDFIHSEIQLEREKRDDKWEIAVYYNTSDEVANRIIEAVKALKDLDQEK